MVMVFFKRIYKSTVENKTNVNSTIKTLAVHEHNTTTKSTIGEHNQVNNRIFKKLNSTTTLIPNLTLSFKLLNKALYKNH